MARNFFNKKFSDYLGEQRALLDIITQFFGATPTPTATPFASPSPTPTATPTRTPSLSPTPTTTVSPTRTPSATATPSVTPSPSQTPFPSPSSSVTPSATPSVTPSITKTPSVTPSATPSATPSLTPFASPSPTPSKTPTPTPSSTPNITAFEFSINTELPGSNVFSFYLPCSGSGYNFSVNWGDGNLDNYSGALNDVLHVYTTPGLYKISITGTFPRIYFNNTGDCQKVTALNRWGNIVWDTLEHGFDGCSNMVYATSDTPDLSACTSLAYLFRFNSNNSFNATLQTWAVSNIQDISYMFAGCANLTENIDNWDTSNVTLMVGTFQGCFNFNSDLGLWSTTNVTDMSYMFSAAQSFNGNITTWDTSNVENFQWMFYKAASFNQDIGNWNTSGIILDTSMDYMFSGAISFNQDLTLWCVLPIPSEPDNFSTGGCPLIDGNKPIWATCPTIPSPTPSVTPTRTATPTPTPSTTVSPTPSVSVSPSVTPSLSPSITPSVTPSLTPSISPSTTPSISVSPSVTPSITPSITQTPFPICPEQLEFSSTTSLAFSGATGTFDRTYSYSGGTITGGYMDGITFTPGPLTGSTYAIYDRYDGSFYYTIIFAINIGFYSYSYIIYKATGASILNGGTSSSYIILVSQPAITDGSVYYPANGGNDYTYISYPAVCPSTTPTPTSTSSVTPTPSATPPSVSVSPTPTPTPSSAGAWTPASLNNLFDWWTADAGVGLSGSDVTGWTGYSGHTLIPYNASYKATYTSSDSDWNNEPSIKFNPNLDTQDCGYYYYLNSADYNDASVIIVAKLIDKLSTAPSSLNNIFTNGIPDRRFGYFGAVSNDEWGYYTQGYTTPSEFVQGGTGYTNGNYMILRYDLNNQTGVSKFFQSTTSNLTNEVQQITGSALGQFNLGNLTIGSYYGVIGAVTPRMSVVEFIKIDGLPSGGEITNLETYINNKYFAPLPSPSVTPTPSVSVTPSSTPPSVSPSPTPTMTPTPSGGGCTPWTPYQLSGVTSMWLDASDGTTLTLSGADVTQWDDKSPNGNDAVGNSGNEPQTGATFNGLTTIEFNTQWFDIPNFALGADATVFMLANRDTTGSFQTIMTLYNGTNAWTELWGSSGFPTDYMYYGVANQEIRGNTSLSDDTYYFTCIKRIYNSATVYDLNLYLNGSADGTGQANDSNLFTDSLIGKDQYNSYFDGNIGEILVFDSALSDANRQKVEGYLAWKWGMEGDLPSGHPYKSSPPCV